MQVISERRKKPRAPLDSDAIIKIGSDSLACRTLDVAVRGIGITGSMHSQPGAEMRIEFKLPKFRDWISVKGVLVRGEQRKGRPVWGIEFTDINHRMVGQIEQYVRDYLVDAARERHRLGRANVVPTRTVRPVQQSAIPARKKPAPKEKSSPGNQYAIDAKDLNGIFKAAIDDLEKK